MQTIRSFVGMDVHKATLFFVAADGVLPRTLSRSDIVNEQMQLWLSQQKPVRDSA